MNYLNGELSYTLNLGTLTAFYRSGAVTHGTSVTSGNSPRTIIDGIRQLDDYAHPLMYYVPFSSSVGYLFFNVKMDYIYYEVSSYQLNVSLYKFDENATLSAINTISYTYLTEWDEDDSTLVTNNAFNHFEYTNYYTSFAVDRQQSVFDLTHLQYYFNDIEGDSTGHIWNSLTSRPDNSLYYNYCLKISGYNLPSVTMDILHASDTQGSIIWNSYEQTYQNGYEHGYYNGYQDGWSTGWNDRNNELGSTIEPTYATAFDYIAKAYDSVASILEIEVLPHVTLGLCFSIPLVFVLIMVLFNLVKK